nr:hypothetical protein [Lachnospiraceae bacterium]
MKYSEYVGRMKEIPYTASLGYRLGYGALTSRGKEWPQIVDILDDTVGIVKIPLYHCRNKRYVRVL